MEIHAAASKVASMKEHTEQQLTAMQAQVDKYKKQVKDAEIQFWDTMNNEIHENESVYLKKMTELEQDCVKKLTAKEEECEALKESVEEIKATVKGKGMEKQVAMLKQHGVRQLRVAIINLLRGEMAECLHSWWLRHAASEHEAAMQEQREQMELHAGRSRLWVPEKKGRN